MAAIAEDEVGVYCNRGDSPGFFVRLLVDAIDFFILAVLTFFLLVGWAMWVPGNSGLGGIAAAVLVVLWWGYLVVLKWSVFGTFGYAIFGVRVVNLKGEAPSLVRLTARTLCFFVFNTLVDLIFLASDDSRQALRDKLTGTYVVKRSAQPAGQGRLSYARVFFFGMALLYREVSRKA
jgi:uncharacterized RDD family membrane protein YckC